MFAYFCVTLTMFVVTGKESRRWHTTIGIILSAGGETNAVGAPSCDEKSPMGDIRPRKCGLPLDIQEQQWFMVRPKADHKTTHEGTGVRTSCC